MFPYFEISKKQSDFFVSRRDSRAKETGGYPGERTGGRTTRNEAGRSFPETTFRDEVGVRAARFFYLHLSARDGQM